MWKMQNDYFLILNCNFDAEISDTLLAEKMCLKWASGLKLELSPLQDGRNQTTHTGPRLLAPTQWHLNYILKHSFLCIWPVISVSCYNTVLQRILQNFAQ